MQYLNWPPPEGIQVLFVLFLSFLIGLERAALLALFNRALMLRLAPAFLALAVAGCVPLLLL